MTDRDPSPPKRTTLKEKLASLDPARREKIEAEAEKMYEEYCYHHKAGSGHKTSQ